MVKERFWFEPTIIEDLGHPFSRIHHASHWISERFDSSSGPGHLPLCQPCSGSNFANWSHCYRQQKWWRTCGSKDICITLKTAQSFWEFQFMLWFSLGRIPSKQTFDLSAFQFKKIIGMWHLAIQFGVHGDQTKEVCLALSPNSCLYWNCSPLRPQTRVDHVYHVLHKPDISWAYFGAQLIQFRGEGGVVWVC